MESVIARELKLKNFPVAVYRSDELPENAMQFREGVWGCVVAMLNATTKGKTAAFCKERTQCQGGRAGLGLAPYEYGFIEKFLSDGEGIPREGERYKKTPELAMDFMKNIPVINKKKYVVFKPLSEIDPAKEEPEIVVFLVNPDQLSGLVTLISYDTTVNDSVKLSFGPGCGQSILFTLAAYEKGLNDCYLGLTDPSARKCIDKNHLSLSIPYYRFLELEKNALECFFHTETWEVIKKRIE